MASVFPVQEVAIRPATIEEKRKLFEWLTNSNLTEEMLGPPRFTDNPVPDWTEFNNDYLDYYFDGSRPLDGQCFVIELDEQEIGQINYNKIDLSEKSTELDIWLKDRKYTGFGLGTRAIELLCLYLENHLGCEKIYIAPSNRNLAAIRSYKKAGFIETNTLPKTFVPDYHDAILMIRRKNK